MGYDESIHRRYGDVGRTDAGGSDDWRIGGPLQRAEPVDLPPDDPGVGWAAWEERQRDFPVGGFRDQEEPETTRRGTAVSDDIFDDPTDGEPGRDRMAVHAWWETLLLFGVGTLAVLVHQADPGLLRGASLDSLLVFATALGLLTIAAGLTLRAAVPNLAIGPVAVAGAVHYAEQGDRGMVAVMVPAVVAALVLGLAAAAVVMVFHVPAWAGTLAAGLVVVVFVQQRTVPVVVQGGWDAQRHSAYLFGGFAALAVLGGLFGSVRTVRRTVGRFRPVTDPARRRGAGAAVVASAAIAASMLLAMLAGVLMATEADTVRPSPGLEWTGLALGTALLGGTSAFGRRAGVFGTVLAVVLLTLFIRYADERDWAIAPAAVAAVVLVIGLVVTRLVETFERPRPAWVDGDDRSETAALPGWGDGRANRQDSWSSALPAQPTDSRLDSWRSDSWRDR